MTSPAHDITKNPFAGMRVISKENASLQKPIILVKGPSGTGKTHFWLTLPGKTVACYTDKNMATATSAITTGQDVELVQPESWEDWADRFVPAVENRLVDADNIVVDTMDMLTKIMWLEIQGGRDKLRIQDFGTGLNRMTNTITQLCSAAYHREGQRSYNIVVTCHTGDVSDDTGSLVKTTCAVMGAFKDACEGLFDYVFLANSEIHTEITGGHAVKSKRFFFHTIPPTRYHTTKAPGYFPAEIGNTWGGLQGALKLNPAQKGQEAALAANQKENTKT
ncbi:MAG: hypothetical protein E4G90_04885 [Gemmatimonadales bacterium]|nr:MAG: hypothetical protein E4G90_04885 [Gemmatimonadales bacterium]